MAGTNTEKPSGKAEQKKQAVKGLKPKKEKKEMLAKAPVQKNEESKENKKAEIKSEENKLETKNEDKKVEVKKVKKSETSVVAENLPVSTKVGIAICKYISQKKVDKVIEELEQVVRLKRAIPMKGEYSHRKGKMMSGKYPTRAAKEFIILLKSLKSNAIQHDIEDPTITKTIANKGSTTYASGGRTKKRTHIKIVCKQKEKSKENKK